MTAGHHRTSNDVNRSLKFPLLAGLFGLFVAFVAAETPPSPEALMDQIRDLMVPKLGSGMRAEDSWPRVLELREQLGACGVEAVPIIESRIASESDFRVRSVLTYSLGLIPGEQVDRILLRLCFSDRGVRFQAESQLMWRTEHNGPFGFTVPDDQIEALLTVVRKEDVFAAGPALRILGMCAKNPPEPILRTIIDRFLYELDHPKDIPPIAGSYTSPRVYVLNKFLLAFSYMAEKSFPYLREALTTARRDRNEERIKWLSMALGLCGDAIVGDYLKEVVLHDSDPYIRCEALRCYARAVGEAARPVLEQLLDDKTETEYHCEGAAWPYFIAVMANGELLRLDREARTSK